MAGCGWFRTKRCQIEREIKNGIERESESQSIDFGDVLCVVGAPRRSFQHPTVGSSSVIADTFSTACCCRLDAQIISQLLVRARNMQEAMNAAKTSKSAGKSGSKKHNETQRERKRRIATSPVVEVKCYQVLGFAMTAQVELVDKVSLHFLQGVKCSYMAISQRNPRTSCGYTVDISLGDMKACNIDSWNSGLQCKIS